jgi:hypothetical protein
MRSILIVADNDEFSRYWQNVRLRVQPSSQRHVTAV